MGTLNRARSLLLACTVCAALPPQRAPAADGKDVEAAQNKVYDEVERYLDRRIAEADKERQAAWRRDFSSAQAYEKSVEPWRRKLMDMLGGDEAYEPGPLDAKEEAAGDFDTHRAYRVWFNAFDDVRVYGVLLVPKPAGLRRSSSSTGG